MKNNGRELRHYVNNLFVKLYYLMSYLFQDTRIVITFYLYLNLLQFKLLLSKYYLNVVNLLKSRMLSSIHEFSVKIQIMLYGSCNFYKSVPKYGECDLHGLNQLLQ